jgi:RNA polymerase sigma-70 factor, ECF subfamily
MLSPTLAAARRAKDTALAERVIARPDETMIAAWRRFRPLVRRILRRMLGADEEVRDLSQETFVQFYRSVRTLRSPDALRAFVAGIAVNLAREEIRRRRVRGNQLLVRGQGLVPLSSTNADPEAREAIAGLYRVVERLRDKDRELFVLRQIDGLEHSEISAVTRLSLSTVRRRLQRLQHRLDVLMQADPALAAYAERASKQKRAERRTHQSAEAARDEDSIDSEAAGDEDSEATGDEHREANA